MSSPTKFPDILADPNASGRGAKKPEQKGNGKGKAPGVRGGFAEETLLESPNSSSSGKPSF
jgi:hypothetical protein